MSQDSQDNQNNQIEETIKQLPEESKLQFEQLDRSANQFHVSESDEDEDNDSKIKQQSTSSQFKNEEPSRVIYEEVQQDEQENFMKKIKEVEQSTMQKTNQITQKAKQAVDEKVEQANQQFEQTQNMLNKAAKETAIAQPILKIVNPEMGQKMEKLNQGLNQASNTFNKASDKFQKEAAQQQKNLNTQLDKANEVINAKKTKQISEESQNKSRTLSEQIKSKSKDVASAGLAGAVAGVATSVANNVLQKGDALVIMNNNEAGQERKQEIFEYIRNWETTRIGIMQSHRNLCDDIFARFERRVNTSEQSMMGIVKYYKERIDQEEKQKIYYANQKSLQKIFKDQDEKIIHVYYPNFSKTLLQVDESCTRQSQNITNLIAFLNKQIKDVFELEQNNYTKTFKDIKDNYNKFKKQLTDSNTECQKYYQKYVKRYQHIMQSKMILKKAPSKDFYNQEKKYKQAAWIYIYGERNYGQFIMKSWYDILRLEAQRLQVIQKSLTDLYSETTLCYGKSELNDLTLQLLTQMKPVEECELFYSTHSILTQGELEFIKMHFPSCQKVTVAEVKSYLENFVVLDRLEKHPLVLKEFRILKDVGTIGKDWKEADIVVTVDHYMLLFENPKSGVHRKADIKMKAADVKLKQRPNEKMDKYMVDVQYLVPGVLMDSKKKLLIKFKSQDEVDELMFFLESIAQKKFLSEES